MDQLISIVGFALCFGAYLLNQRNIVKVESWQYNWMYVIGSSCLLYVSVPNIGLSLIQIAFGGVALHKIIDLKLYPR